MIQALLFFYALSDLYIKINAPINKEAFLYFCDSIYMVDEKCDI